MLCCTHLRSAHQEKQRARKRHSDPGAGDDALTFPLTVAGMGSPQAISLDLAKGDESAVRRAGRVRAARQLRRAAPELTAMVVTLAVSLWGITGPSLWWDEMATVEVSGHRSAHDMIRVLSHVDAVHGFYYFFMHAVTKVLGTGPLAMRLPSAIAMMAAAGGLVMLGRRLGSVKAGLYSGLVFGMMPIVARYGQEARSYGIVTALAVYATVVFVVSLQTGRRRWYALYAALIGLMGVLHLMALLLVAAHGLTLALARAERRRQRFWVMAAVAGCALASPVVLIGLTQRRQLAWVVRPGLVDLLELSANLCGAHPLVAPISALIGAALVGARAGGLLRGLTPMTVALPIAAIPPAVMLGVTPIHPLYVFRYGLYAVTGVALLAGTGLARLHWTRALPCVVLIGALAIPDLLNQHHEGSRADDPQAAAATFDREVRPGDAIFYVPTQTRLFSGSFPASAARLDDIALKTAPWVAGNLGGIEVSDAELAQRLRGVDRVWIYYEPWLGGDGALNKRLLDDKIAVLRSAGFAGVGIRELTGITLGIFARQPASAPASPAGSPPAPRVPLPSGRPAVKTTPSP